MDCAKVGNLILRLRKEKHLTQRQLADRMNISDKTVSKWERGMGAPDVSLLAELSKALKVDVVKLLEGNLNENEKDLGNMKRIKFYLCQNCGNVLMETGEADVSCCGRKLMPLVKKPADGEHKLTVTDTGGEYYVTFNHEMSKTHYISFIAHVSCDRALLVRLYPEQGGEVLFPKMYKGKFYYGCNQHGLWVSEG